MARAAYGNENSSPAVRMPAGRTCKERDGRMLDRYSMPLNAPPVAEDRLASLASVTAKREIVELTAAIGGYNPVSHFLEVLAMDPESAHI